MKKGFFISRGYTDDGCSEYLCLGCYNSWEGRSGRGFNFCPYCGDAIKFQESEERENRWTDTRQSVGNYYVETRTGMIAQDGTEIWKGEWSYPLDRKEMLFDLEDTPEHCRSRVQAVKFFKDLKDNPGEKLFNDPKDIEILGIRIVRENRVEHKIVKSTLIETEVELLDGAVDV